MANRTLVSCLLFLGLFLSLSIGLNAQVEKLKLKADYTRYDEDTKQLIASQNVEIIYQNVKITAPYIRLDTLTNTLTSVGKIRIEQGEDIFDSSYLFFDLNNDVIKIRDIHIGITPPESDELIFIKAKTLEDYGDYKLGTQGLFTSCELDDPHYFVWSSHFKYDPDKRIIGYNTVLYTPFFLIPFPLPLVTLHYSPIYSYDVGKRQHVWNFPSIGKKEADGWGWFVQNTFDYNHINGEDSSIFVDWFENKGIGLGIRHQYLLGEQNRGTVYYYQLKERDTQLMNEKKSIQQEFYFKDHYKIDAGYSTVDAERLSYSGRNISEEKFAKLYYDNIGSKYDLSFKENQDFKQQYESKKASFNRSFNKFKRLNASYNESKRSSSGFLSKSATLDHQLPFPNDILLKNTLTFSQEHHYRDDPHADDKLKYNMRYKQKLTESISTTLDIDHFIDLDENRVTSDSFSSKNDFFFKHPELTINYKNAKFYGLNLKQDTILGRYQEVRFDNSTKKTRRFPDDFSGQMLPNTYIFKQSVSKSFKQLPQDGSLNLSTGFNQYVFKNPGYSLGEGDSMNNLTFSASLKSKHFGFMKSSSSYASAYAPVEGNSPFHKFKRDSSSLNEVSQTLTFYIINDNKYYWENRSGYNWITDVYKDWQTKLFIKPNQNIQWVLTTGQDLNPETDSDRENKYQDFNSQLNFSPTDNVKLKHTINFDTNNYVRNDKATVKSSSFTLDFTLGKQKDYAWKFQTFWVYQTNDGEFDYKQYELRTISLMKEEHRRTVYLSYDKLLEEIRFKLTINVFPDDPVGFKKTKDVWKVEGILDDKTEERL